MVTTTVNDYWISSTAVSISLNAMGNSDYVQVGIAPNASIVAYVKGVIDYDASHKCKSWKLVGSPTAFGDSDPKYVYVAIPRSDQMENQNAIVVFPSELIDIYGKNGTGQQKGNDNYYYIYLQGLISASVVGGVETARKFTQVIQTGKLMSDDALMNKTDSEWYSYSAVTGRVSFLKEIIMEATSKFINLIADKITATQITLSEMVFNGKTLNGVADEHTGKESDSDLVTPKGGKNFFLSKLDDDTANGNLTFKGTLDVFGNLVAKSNATVNGDVLIGGDGKVEGSFDIGDKATIGGNATVEGNLFVGSGETGSETFDTGLLGTGWRIGNTGNAEMDSLILRKFLEVPELRYNRISVRTGVQWQTFGGGIIEAVRELDATHGIIKLKLEEGEVGAIQKDDRCMGIFHNETDPSANSDHDSDERNGNFAFKGFMTIYFIVTDLCDENGNVVEEGGRKQYFKYELRSASDTTWADAHHPQASMSFAAYANANDSSRQACIYSTTTYLNMLTGMTGWTYGGNNIAMIYGNLNGFTIRSKQGSVIQLEGYGIAFGNAYMWGNIKQFERESFLISQQAYYTATADVPEIVLNDPEYASHYTWTTISQPVKPEAPYAYVYWKQTFDDGSVKNEGLSMYSFDNSALSVVLNKQIVSIALSNWYDDENPTDIVSFNVEAKLKLGNSYIDIESVNVTSNVEGFTCTHDLVDENKRAIIHVKIDGYVPSQVSGAVAENGVVNIELSAGNNVSSSSVTIADNRQGENGEDGKSAPRKLYKRATSLPATPLEENPSDWSSLPQFETSNLNIDSLSPLYHNAGFEKTEASDEGVIFKSLCQKTSGNCSWMSMTIKGKAGDTISIPYVIDSGANYCAVTTTRPMGDIPRGTLLKENGKKSGTLQVVLNSDEITLYFGYVISVLDRGEYEGFTVKFGRLYSTTEELDEDGRFVKWVGVVSEEGVNGKDGEDGENGEDGTSPVILTADLSAITWPMSENEVEAGTPPSVIRLSMNIGDRSVSSFTSVSASITGGNGDGIDSIVPDKSAGTVTVSPDTNCDIDSSRNKVITITATAEGYTRTTSVSLTIVAAGESTTGPQGIQGCVVRQCGKYNKNTAYYNDSERSNCRQGESVRYIDIVQFESNGIVNYYERKTNNQGEKGIDPTNADYWQEANKFSFIATEILMADAAWIEALTGKAVYITDDDEKNNVVAGMQSVSDNETPIIFAGASKNDAKNATFRVFPNGDVHAESFHAVGEIEGRYESETGDYAEFSLHSEVRGAGLYMTNGWYRDGLLTQSSFWLTSDPINGGVIDINGHYYSHFPSGDEKGGDSQLYTTSQSLSFSRKNIIGNVKSSGGFGAIYDGLFICDAAPSDSLSYYKYANYNLKNLFDIKNSVSITTEGIELKKNNSSFKIDGTGFVPDGQCDENINTGWVKIRDSSGTGYVYLRFKGGILMGVDYDDPGAKNILN